MTDPPPRKPTKIPKLRLDESNSSQEDRPRCNGPPSASIAPFMIDTMRLQSYGTNKNLLSSDFCCVLSMEHKLCMIPGPCEFHEDVLAEMASKSMSHVDEQFIKEFGDCLRMLRIVFKCSKGQGFIVSGSGTLGWDAICSNLLSPNDSVLVLNCGVFGDRFVDCLNVYQCNVTNLTVDIGKKHELTAVEDALKSKKYKMITITQVDTSTGVLSDVKGITQLVKKISPDTLIAVDGVCSIAGEELDMDSWGIDVAMTGSQKSIGVPAGLCLLMASERAISVRKSSPSCFYTSWERWIPIMKAYESGTPSYFATPAVHLIKALRKSLIIITEKIGIDQCVSLHAKAASITRSTISELGLKLVAESPANTMTAVYLPEKLEGKTLLKSMSERGIVIAGGLHPKISSKYFRIGHMGLTVWEPERGYLTKTLEALKAIIKKL